MLCGLEMGNCFSSKWDIATQNFRNTSLEQLSFEFLFFRYIDALCNILSWIQRRRVTQWFQNDYPKSQFTIEREDEGKLTFHIILSRKQNIVIYNWCHKLTFLKIYQCVYYFFTWILKVFKNLKNKTMTISNRCFWNENSRK